MITKTLKSNPPFIESKEEVQRKKPENHVLHAFVVQYYHSVQLGYIFSFYSITLYNVEGINAIFFNLDFQFFYAGTDTQLKELSHPQRYSENFNLYLFLFACIHCVFYTFSHDAIYSLFLFFTVFTIHILCGITFMKCFILLDKRALITYS